MNPNDIEDYREKLKTLDNFSLPPWTSKIPDRFTIATQLGRQLEDDMKNFNEHQMPTPSVRNSFDPPIAMLVCSVLVVVAWFIVFVLLLYRWWHRRSQGWVILAVPTVTRIRRAAPAEGQSNRGCDVSSEGGAAVPPTTVPPYPGAHPAASPSATVPPEYPPSYDSDQLVHGNQTAGATPAPPPPPPY